MSLVFSKVMNIYSKYNVFLLIVFPKKGKKD